MLTPLILVFASSLSTANVLTQQSSSPAPRVYVFTEPPKGEAPTEEEQGRLDSVKDVREALGRKAGLNMVTSASDASVLVEVIEREKRDGGAGGFGGSSVTPQGEVLIRLHLKFGEHETDIKGTAAGYWGRAAKDAAERAFKWIVRIDNMPGKRGEQHVPPGVD